MKAAVSIIKFFERLPSTGLRGKLTAGFFSGLLKLISPRAKLIDSNLKRVFPESSKDWRKKIRRGVYENLAWTLTEALVLKRDPSQAFQWVKQVKNIEIFNDVIKNKKGALFITGHFGNWELGGTWAAQQALRLGGRLNVIFQEMHDLDISEYVRDMRNSNGMFMLDKNFSVMKLAHMLRSGEPVALLNDVSGSPNMHVPFMGIDSTNMPGPAVLAMLGGVPVIPFCIYRLAPFEHEAEFFEPLKLPDKNLNHEERTKLILLEMNKAIEKFIRKRPELWFWLHNRWKVRS
ncbi:MAG: lysophospholipid acyltransferase family protein [Synergistaceae bacterium]|nr:lysophospholipid acyltransferase family protein [Synergistaceae bacterium]